MHEIITGSFAKELDRFAIETLGIPSAALMERAAHAVFEQAKKAAPEKTEEILLFCGVGNNGADGLCAGAMLLADGYRNVRALICGKEEKASEEFCLQKRRFLSAGGKASAFDESFSEHAGVPALILDALFGIGLKRRLEGSFAAAVEAMNLLRNEGSYVISVDMPSGIDADRGANLCAPLYPVHADETVTFGFGKTGQYLGFGFDRCGKLTIADIGYPRESPAALMERQEKEERKREKAGEGKEGGDGGRKAEVPQLFLRTEAAFLEYAEDFLKRDRRANKGSYRKLLIIGGAEGMAGAAYLSGLAAYRSGVGMVRYLGPAENRTILQSLLPEAMYACWTEEAGMEASISENLDWADIVILGPGLSQSAYAELLAARTLKEIKRRGERGPVLIVDADALNILAKEPALMGELTARMVLTPHVGELARLCGTTIDAVKKNLAETARSLSERCGVLVAAKDCVTVVSEPGGRLYLNTDGGAALSKAGSGDVLTGAIAGAYAVTGDLDAAVPAGVYLHGLAGVCAAEKFGEHGTLARDAANALSEAASRAAERLKSEIS